MSETHEGSEGLIPLLVLAAVPQCGSCGLCAHYKRCLCGQHIFKCSYGQISLGLFVLNLQGECIPWKYLMFLSLMFCSFEDI